MSWSWQKMWEWTGKKEMERQNDPHLESKLNKELADHDRPPTDEELKPCPFCGGKSYESNTFVSCNQDNGECPVCAYAFDVNIWNNRPIEDQLRADLLFTKSELEAAESDAKFGEGKAQQLVKAEANLAEIAEKLDEAELGEGFAVNLPFIKGIATRHKEKE